MIRWIGDAGWHMSDLCGHLRDAGEVRDGKRRRRLVLGTLADLGTELMTFADHDSSHAPARQRIHSREAVFRIAGILIR